MDIQLYEIACCNCGIAFWVTKAHNAELVDKKRLFYCPNGHSQSYSRNAEDRLREQIEMKDRQLVFLREELAQKCRKPKSRKKRK